MMMKGYDREKAIAFMLPKLIKAEFKPLAGQCEKLLSDAIEADMAYMLKAGVLDAEGMMGDAYYDDDDAFEALLDTLGEDADDDEMGELAQMLDSYMAAQQDFMEASGLME